MTTGVVTGSPRAGGAAGLRRWAPLLLLLVVAVGALAVGSQRHTSPTLQQRTLALAGRVRCPVCDGESAAQSDVTQSVSIRNQIRQELAEGRSDSQVLDQLETAYGAQILESPPTHGLGLAVWLLPLVIIAAAAGGLGLAFARWRRSRSSPYGSEADRSLVAEALAGGADEPPVPPGPPARPDAPDAPGEAQP